AVPELPPYRAADFLLPWAERCRLRVLDRRRPHARAARLRRAEASPGGGARSDPRPRFRRPLLARARARRGHRFSRLGFPAAVRSRLALRLVSTSHGDRARDARRG